MVYPYEIRPVTQFKNLFSLKKDLHTKNTVFPNMIIESEQQI